MNRFFHSVPVWVITLIVISGCGARLDRKAEQVTELLESLESELVPDSRIQLWDMQVETVDGALHLSGMVEEHTIVEAVKSAMEQEFSKVQVSVELLPSQRPGELVHGLINNSVAHLRSRPSHRADIVTQALLGMPVRIYKRISGWFLIQMPSGYIGWVDEAGVEEMDEEALARHRQLDKIVYNRQYGFTYFTAEMESLPVSDLVVGNILPVISAIRGFLEVEYPDGRTGWVPSEETLPLEELLGRSLEKERLVTSAKQYLGIPYLWGGTSSKGIDCSGFSTMIYYMSGTQLMRDADQQSFHGKLLTSEYDHTVLEPGDLLFYGRKATDTQSERVTHVAMYIGDTEFIHASGKVKVNSMDPDRSNYIPEYKDIFVRAVRIIGEPEDGFTSLSNNRFYKEIISWEP